MKIGTLFALFLFLLTTILGGCGPNPEKSSQEVKTKDPQAKDMPNGSPSDDQRGRKGISKFTSNSPPKIIRSRILPAPAFTNTDLSLEVECEDPDGDIVTYTYQWFKAQEGDERDEEELKGETNPTLSHTLFVRGDILAARITPSDGRSTGKNYYTNWMVIANSPPEITSSPPETFSGKGLYTYQVQAFDADNDRITFSLGKRVPEGMSIDPETGLVTWIIKPEASGVCEFTVEGDDGHRGMCSQCVVHSVRTFEK